MVFKETYITSKHKFFSFSLKELYHYKDLLFLLVRRDFVSIYKQTILGPLWFFIQPIFNAAINLFVFGSLAGIGPDGVPGFLFYLSGPILWQYFQDCLTKTSETFVTNRNIFGKVYFPRLIVPLSIVISNLLKFGVQFLLLIVALIYYYFRSGYVAFSTNLLFLPLLIIIMGMLGLGLGLIVTSLTTKYRDLRFLIQFGVPLLKYLTPGIATTYAIYITRLPKAKWVADFNPIGHLIDYFNLIMVGAGSFNAKNILYSVAFTTVVLFLGILVFNKTEKTFMDNV